METNVFTVSWIPYAIYLWIFITYYMLARFTKRKASPNNMIYYIDIPATIGGILSSIVIFQIDSLSVFALMICYANVIVLMISGIFLHKIAWGIPIFFSILYIGMITYTLSWIVFIIGMIFFCISIYTGEIEDYRSAIALIVLIIILKFFDEIIHDIQTPDMITAYSINLLTNISACIGYQIGARMTKTKNV